MKPDGAYIICMIAEADEETPGIPSTREKCSECSCDVWVTTASKVKAVAESIEYICFPCVCKDPAFINETIKILPMSDPQLEEFMDYVRRNVE